MKYEKDTIFSVSAHPQPRQLEVRVARYVPFTSVENRESTMFVKSSSYSALWNDRKNIDRLIRHYMKLHELNLYHLRDYYTKLGEK